MSDKRTSGRVGPLGYPCENCAVKEPRHYCPTCRAARRRVQQRTSQHWKRHGVPYKEVPIPPQAVPALVHGLDSLEGAVRTLRRCRAGDEAGLVAVRDAIDQVIAASDSLSLLTECQSFRAAAQLVHEVEAGRLSAAPTTLPPPRDRMAPGRKPRHPRGGAAVVDGQDKGPWTAPDSPE